MNSYNNKNHKDNIVISLVSIILLGLIFPYAFQDYQEKQAGVELSQAKIGL